MILSLIVAANLDGAIGKDNQLLWRLPTDLKRFKRITMGKPVIMGRKTFESIGKPLPGRISIVITRNPEFRPDGVIVSPSLEDAVKKARDTGIAEAMVIGGGEIYRQALPAADKIYLTRVYEKSEGDTFFSFPAEENWEVAYQERHSKDDRHAYDFEFVDLVKK